MSQSVGLPKLTNAPTQTRSDPGDLPLGLAYHACHPPCALRLRTDHGPDTAGRSGPWLRSGRTSDWPNEVRNQRPLWTGAQDRRLGQVAFIYLRTLYNLGWKNSKKRLCRRAQDLFPLQILCCRIRLLIILNFKRHLGMWPQNELVGVSGAADVRRELPSFGQILFGGARTCN